MAKLSAAEQKEITKLLTRIYQDILEIESQYELQVGGGDYRCRIEYFHDAVQAFFSGKPEHVEEGGRLQIELLAYDLKCLRYIQENPFASFTPKGKNLSAQTALAPKAAGLIKQTAKPNRAMREQLGEYYRHYAVLFAALLKITADEDYEERTHHLNEDVRDINTIAEQLKNSAGKSDGLDALVAEVAGMEEAQLRAELMAFIQAGKVKDIKEVKKLLAYLKGRKKEKDERIASIDTAHMEYAANQLAIYEASRDMLKSMAQRGMNLVGKFVEASIAQTRREMGR